MDGSGKSNSIMLSIEDSVIFSHEYVSENKHLILQIHLHDSTLTLLFLSEEAAVLGYWWVDPLIWLEGISMAIDNIGEFSKFLDAITLNVTMSGWKPIFLKYVESIVWHSQKAAAWVNGDDAISIGTTDAERASTNEDIIESHSIHVAEDDWVPLDLANELGLVIVSKGQIWLLAKSWGAEVEGEEVVFQEILFHHVVENGNDTWLSKSWVGQSNNGLVVWAENIVLFLDISELLVLDGDGAWSRANGHIIINEVTIQLALSEWNESPLIGSLASVRLAVIESKALNSLHLRV